jgi:hypothetical protein
VKEVHSKLPGFGTHGKRTPSGEKGEWPDMTIAKVKDLREKLSKLDDNASIFVYWEDGKEHQFFGIDDVALARGTPSRLTNGGVSFAFDNKGPATWAFIEVSPE